MSEDQNNPATVSRSAEEQADLLARITTLFEQQITFNEYLGFKIDSLEPEPVKIRFDMRPELIGHFQFGRLHGGVVSSVLDVAGGLAVMLAIARFFNGDSADQVLKRFSNLATIDLRVDYLRPGLGDSFCAQANVVRLGRRVAATQILLFNDQESLIATGNANYIVS